MTQFASTARYRTWFFFTFAIASFASAIAYFSVTAFTPLHTETEHLYLN